MSILLFFGSIVIKREKIFVLRYLIFAEEVFQVAKDKECSELNSLRLQRKISKQPLISFNSGLTIMKVSQ